MYRSTQQIDVFIFVKSHVMSMWNCAMLVNRTLLCNTCVRSFEDYQQFQILLINTKQMLLNSLAVTNYSIWLIFYTIHILLTVNDYLNFLYVTERTVDFTKTPSWNERWWCRTQKVQTQSTHSVSTLTYFIVYYRLFIYHFILIFLYTK